MKKRYFLFAVLLMLVGVTAYADDAVLDPFSWLTQIWQAIGTFGTLPWGMKVATIVFLIIGSMKVSILNQLFWDKLGKAKAWLAPFLGLVYGIFAISAGGAPITVGAVFAYISAGAGAIIVKELLEMIKVIPGIGPTYVLVIDFIESVLNPSVSQAKKLAAQKK